MSAVETPPPAEMDGPFAVARQPIPHDSAELHVSGRAQYIDDMREPAGTLHMAPGWCPNIAKGVIREVDLTRVKAAPASSPFSPPRTCRGSTTARPPSAAIR